MEQHVIVGSSDFFADDHQVSGYMQQVVQPFCEMSQPQESMAAPMTTTVSTRKKKTRTMFSNCQLTLLETTFRQAPYPDAYTRKELANRLGLDETRVQVWFQNRRAKWRKKKALMPETSLNMMDMM